VERDDESPLEAYGSVLLRLMEEIVALGGSADRGSQSRAHLEAQLGLRRRLTADEAELQSIRQSDARVRAFCSNDTPQIFHAIAHAHDVWRRDPFDVPSVHGETRDVFERLLDRASAAPEDASGRLLLVLGEAGAGKTHLMRAFRNLAHGSRLGYAGYMQMSSATNDYARYALVNLLESLEHPFDAPEVQATGLRCLSDALLSATPRITPQQRRTLREAELDRPALADLVCELADELLRTAALADVDVDLLRALLYLQRDDPPIRARVLKLLRCEPLSDQDTRVLGGVAPKTHGEDPQRMLTQLGKLIGRSGGGTWVMPARWTSGFRAF